MLKFIIHVEHKQNAATSICQHTKHSLKSSMGCVGEEERKGRGGGGRVPSGRCCSPSFSFSCSEQQPTTCSIKRLHPQTNLPPQAHSLSLSLCLPPVCLARTHSTGGAKKFSLARGGPLIFMAISFNSFACTFLCKVVNFQHSSQPYTVVSVCVSLSLPLSRFDTTHAPSRSSCCS